MRYRLTYPLWGRGPWHIVYKAGMLEEIATILSISTMAPTLTNAFSEFLHSLTNIAGSLANSIIAVFTAILVLCQNTILGLFSLGNSLVKLVLDVFQGFAGFVAGEYDDNICYVFVLNPYTGNFILLAVLIGAYFLYQSRQGNRSQTRSIKT